MFSDKHLDPAKKKTHRDFLARESLIVVFDVIEVIVKVNVVVVVVVDRLRKTKHVERCEVVRRFKSARKWKILVTLGCLDEYLSADYGELFFRESSKRKYD